MSRAKLGLYVFGRVALFEQCAELSPVMSLLLKKPTKLQLVGGEHFPAKRKVSAQPLRVMFFGFPLFTPHFCLLPPSRCPCRRGTSG